LMPRRKRIALIAHDNCKVEMLEWAQFNVKTLAAHELYATGTTGALLANELGLSVDRFFSGPLGGDQQVGAAIAEGRIDFLVFFWDPLEPQPHDVDLKALLRIAVVCNVPTACNRATADFILSSPLTGEEYQPATVPTLGQPWAATNWKRGSTPVNARGRCSGDTRTRADAPRRANRGFTLARCSSPALWVSRRLH
jgi:methylglyoxal synthase